MMMDTRVSLCNISTRLPCIVIYCVLNFILCRILMYRHDYGTRVSTRKWISGGEKGVQAKQLIMVPGRYSI